jgi:ER lumen protein retaining receptor
MKVFYISVTVLTICKIKCLEPIKSVYNADQDSFPIWTCAVLPSLILGFAISALFGYNAYGYNLLECLWLSSIFLESIAILPQLLVLRRYRLVENLTGKFMLCLGSYRVFYIFNWIYRSHTEPGIKHHYAVYIAGIIQACMYLDFFVQYIKISPLPCCGKKNENDDDDEGLIFEIARTQERAMMGEVSSDPLLVETEDTTNSASSKDLVERRSRSAAKCTAEAKV